MIETTWVFYDPNEILPEDGPYWYVSVSDNQTIVGCELDEWEDVVPEGGRKALEYPEPFGGLGNKPLLDTIMFLLECPEYDLVCRIKELLEYEAMYKDLE